MPDSSVFITTVDEPGHAGPRVAVKDLIDIVGYPTTAGSRVVAEYASPADKDAACLAGLRAADARIVGKANLVELALGTSGINPWFGTPLNPVDALRVPGGSSSGSAVAVAIGECDIALGSDTGGSIRIPAGCCGIVGLKTTFGRVSVEGTQALAPSLDTIGPMARNVADTVLGMQLLEPGFSVAEDGPLRIGRLRLPTTDAMHDAITMVLKSAELDIENVEITDWATAWKAATILIEYEAALTYRPRLDRLEDFDEYATLRLSRGVMMSDKGIAAAYEMRDRWRFTLSELFERFDVLVAPTFTEEPPLVADGPVTVFPNHSPVNLAGLPALSMPVASPETAFASVQLIGRPNDEETLLALAGRLEAAAN